MLWTLVLTVLSGSAAWAVSDVERPPGPARPGPPARPVAPVAVPVAPTTTTTPSTVDPVPTPAADPGSDRLAAAFAAAGYELPEGTSVYVARVREGGGGLRYDEAEAGGGAYDTAFWPASSIKVIAAIGALEYLRTLGFTGDATVSSAASWTSSVRDLYVAALRDSSNEAYDRLVQIAGVDWLNQYFLPDDGFPATVIQRSYSGEGVASAAMTVTEGDRSVDVAARVSDTDDSVPDDGNRSDLHDMVDAVRRITLDPELPAGDRLGLAPDDLAAMTQALLDSEGFVEPGVADALGDGALVYNKPGWAPGEACVDVGLVVDPATGDRWLLGVASPDDGGACTALADIAALALPAL
ncbi:MAG TPA: serine hydrolase [Acidimicrobiales bacterium]|nr:serine hydrolase [Acidimicrobiales bacterium]